MPNIYVCLDLGAYEHEFGFFFVEQNYDETEHTLTAEMPNGKKRVTNCNFNLHTLPFWNENSSSYVILTEENTNNKSERVSECSKIWGKLLLSQQKYFNNSLCAHPIPSIK